MRLNDLTEGKKDYEIYHKSLTSAVEEALAFAKKNGYKVDDDDVWHNISTGPKKPSDGKTNKYSLPLYKGDKLQKKQLHFQVYGMSDKYELNMYIS